MAGMTSLDPRHIPCQLPPDAPEWRGTAASLAAYLNSFLPEAQPLYGEPRPVTERLIRYYVTEGLLSEPAVAGRERLFSHLHLTEYLAARKLVADGWPLAKVRGLRRGKTPAERVIEQLRSSPAGRPSKVNESASQPLFFQPSFSASAPPSASFDALQRAAESTQRRSQLRADLQTLGNAAGTPEVTPVVHLQLAPWCQVYINPQQLENADSDTLQRLGQALTAALEEQKLHTGEAP
jgi:DNA-binding transcriptional MerR regulator